MGYNYGMNKHEPFFVTTSYKDLRFRIWRLIFQIRIEKNWPKRNKNVFWTRGYRLPNKDGNLTKFSCGDYRLLIKIARISIMFQWIIGEV